MLFRSVVVLMFVVLVSLFVVLVSLFVVLVLKVLVEGRTLVPVCVSPVVLVMFVSLVELPSFVIISILV